VLEEVRQRIDQELEARQERGGLLDELCGSLHGSEHVDDQAYTEHAQLRNLNERLRSQAEGLE